MAGLYAVADYDPRAAPDGSGPEVLSRRTRRSCDRCAAANSISVSIVNVTITYADGVRETLVLNNMQDMGDASTWRVDIG